MRNITLKEAFSVPARDFTGALKHSKVMGGMLSAYFENIVKPFPDVQDKIATFACMDSRWPPSLVFGQDLGSSYGIRNIANLASWSDGLDPYAMPMQMLEAAAAFEYLIAVKKVSKIIVMGHTDCGGAKAHMTGGAPDFVQKWVDQVPFKKPELREEFAAELKNFSLKFHGMDHNSYEKARRAAEEKCLHHTVAAIKSMPFAKAAIEENRLSIAGIIGRMYNDNGALDISFDGAFEAGVLQEILKRFAEFKKDAWGPDGAMPNLVENGQNPGALIITGISPYLSGRLFNIRPGDSFVYRNLGGRYNFTGEADGLSAAIQFAVATGVKEIIHVGSIGDVNRDYVLGELDEFKYVRAFIELSTPGIREMRAAGGSPEALQFASVRNTLQSIKRHPSVIAANGEVVVTSIVKDHENERLLSLNPANDGFISIEPERAFG